MRKDTKREGGGEYSDTFSSFHPAVNLLYFTTVIGFAMFFTHPVCLAISLICAIIYSFFVNGIKALRFTVAFMLPALIVTALLNPIFNHQGGTILAYLPDGNPLTLESVLYGASAATTLVTVITWFSCFNKVMTSDKFVFLFGRAVPALSLVLSMALRFVPRFRNQIRIISDAQKCIGRGAAHGNLLQKMKHGVKIISILTTWSLENAIETADSMKRRGYGLPGRTAFQLFIFDRHDAYAFIYMLACSVGVVAGAATGAYSFRYYPTVKGEWTGVATLVVFAAYFALGAFPIFINIKEGLVWRAITSKT